MNKALLIIAQQGFQDHELDPTRDALLEAGFEVVLASENQGLCTGKCGSEEQASVAMREVNIADYDRIAFIGGPGAHALCENADAHRIAQETVKSGKVLGAICIAPAILAAAGVLKAKRATVWNGDGEEGIFLIQHGADYTGEDVTIDGLIITADGPESAEKFGEELARLK